MRRSQVGRFSAALGVAFLALAAQPAAARRTVFDTFGSMDLGAGYCSPNTCESFSTPFSVQIGGTSYNTFYANSNGTLSFGSIWWPYLAAETPDPFVFGQGPFIAPPPVTNLATYPVPIFSPNFVDGPGFDNADTIFEGIFDGNFVAQTSIDANSFTTSWYACEKPQACGLDTLDAVLGTSFDTNSNWIGFLEEFAAIPDGICQGNCTDEEIFLSGQQNYADRILSLQPIYTMTLTNLTGGFQVDFSYNQASAGQLGTYGYSLPSGSDQATGPLTNQSYFFSSHAPPHTVPEPATWMMMLLGFATMGLALRRNGKPQALAA